MNFKFSDLFPNWFSKKTYDSFLESEIKGMLDQSKKITKRYKQGNHIITETTYSGNGFEYTEVVSEYEPKESDLKIYQLQGELDKAVESEDYTQAANIKKQIDELKQPKTTNEKDNNN